MNIFEYLMVMVSIILGIGVTQTLRGLGRVVRSSDGSPIVIAWAVVLFLLHIQTWWALWDLNAVESWSQPTFFFVVGIPCALFAATEMLLPFGSNSQVNWNSHFVHVRPWFYGALLVFLIIATLETWVMLGAPLLHPYRIMQLFVIGTALAGLLVNRRRVHFWLALAFLLGLLIGQVMFRIAPEGFWQ